MNRDEAERWHTGQTGLHPANPDGHKIVRGWETSMHDLPPCDCHGKPAAKTPVGHYVCPVTGRIITEEVLTKMEMDALNRTEHVRKVQGHGIDE